MGETSTQIEQHIVQQRQKLDRDLRRLERKARLEARSLATNTGFVVGVLIAAGFLVSLALSRVLNRADHRRLSAP